MTENAFDPADATVEEVNEYLETATDAERERVLDLEGQDGRKGIVDGPHKLGNPALAPGGFVEDPQNVPEGTRVDASGRVLYDWEVEGAANKDGK